MPERHIQEVELNKHSLNVEKYDEKEVAEWAGARSQELICNTTGATSKASPSSLEGSEGATRSAAEQPRTPRSFRESGLQWAGEPPDNQRCTSCLEVEDIPESAPEESLESERRPG